MIADLIPPASGSVHVDATILHRGCAKLLRDGHPNRRGWQEIQPLGLLHSASSECQFVQPFGYWSGDGVEADATFRTFVHLI